MPGVIVEWLGAARQPDHYYAMLGLPLFCADGERVLASVRRAVRELLPYQNHRDPAIAKRAVLLLSELGRAEEALGSDAHRRAYDGEVLLSLVDLWVQARFPASPVIPTEVEQWLVHEQHIDPVVLTKTRDEITRLLSVRQFANAAPGPLTSPQGFPIPKPGAFPVGLQSAVGAAKGNYAVPGFASVAAGSTTMACPICRNAVRIPLSSSATLQCPHCRSLFHWALPNAQDNGQRIAADRPSPCESTLAVSRSVASRRREQRTGARLMATSLLFAVAFVAATIFAIRHYTGTGNIIALAGGDQPSVQWYSDESFSDRATNQAGDRAGRGLSLTVEVEATADLVGVRQLTTEELAEAARLNSTLHVERGELLWRYKLSTDLIKVHAQNGRTVACDSFELAGASEFSAREVHVNMATRPDTVRFIAHFVVSKSELERGELSFQFRDSPAVPLTRSNRSTRAQR